MSLGASAVPALEEALSSINSHNGQTKFSVNAWWLLHAYARIRGQSAFPMLSRMIVNPGSSPFNSIWKIPLRFRLD